MVAWFFGLRFNASMEIYETPFQELYLLCYYVFHVMRSLAPRRSVDYLFNWRQTRYNRIPEMLLLRSLILGSMEPTSLDPLIGRFLCPPNPSLGEFQWEDRKKGGGMKLSQSSIALIKTSLRRSLVHFMFTLSAVTIPFNLPPSPSKQSVRIRRIVFLIAPNPSPCFGSASDPFTFDLPAS
jgi:hypothetical protein